MTAQLVNFQRTFQIWLYSASHTQLLLRSTKSKELPTRVDVLFKDVAALALPTLFDGLSISEATADEARNLNMPLGNKEIDGRKVLLVRGSNFLGYVVAGYLYWHEDEGDHFDESRFQESFLHLRV